MRALVVLFALLAVSGCLSGPAGPTAAPSDAEPALEPLRLAVPAPDLDRIAQWHRDFVTTHVKRDTGSPTNLAAGRAIADALSAAGWDVQVLEFAPGGVLLPTATGAGVNVVVGLRPGATDAVLGWVSHFDTAATTIEGAYDDGSGVAVGVELARMFADYPNSKTLAAVFFDTEELGLVASDYFVREVVGSETARWHAVVGHDMVGANWPGHEWPMYQMIGEPHVDPLLPLETRLYREVLSLPEDGVVILDVHDRNSDEQNFKAAGVPVLRMAGGRRAADYPQYHKPDDTVEYLLDFVGGAANWKRGLGTVLNTTAWNLAVLDLLPHPEEAGFEDAAHETIDRILAAQAAGPGAAAPDGSYTQGRFGRR